MKLTTSNLRTPVFPLKQIIAAPEKYKESIRLRKVNLYKNKSIDDLLSLLETQKHLSFKLKNAATLQNKINREIKEILLKKNQKDVMPSIELKQLSASAKKQRADATNELAFIDTEIAEVLDTVPNLVDPKSALIEGDFEEITRFGNKTLIPHDPNRDHVQIGLSRELFDFEASSKVSGTGNVYLTGAGAMLEQALIMYTLNKLSQFGFKQISPPTLVRPEFLAACGFRPRKNDEDTHIYETDNGNLTLSGTAEIPLISQLTNQQIPDLEVPKFHCAVSRCFRREAGSRGADTRGLYRLHEFTKVEMVSICKSDQSEQVFEKLVEIQKSIFTEILGSVNTQMRVINVAPHDLGAPAFKKYDIEAWMPGRNGWGEISSTSNCLDFQSRRLHIKHNNEFVHTLNGTAMAVPRVLLAIIENGYENGKVRVPEVLRKYVGDYV